MDTKHPPAALYVGTRLRQRRWSLTPAARTSFVLRVRFSGHSQDIVILNKVNVEITPARSVGLISFRLCETSVKGGLQKDIVVGHCAWR